MHLHQTSICYYNYYSGFYMWVSDVKLLCSRFLHHCHLKNAAVSPASVSKETLLFHLRFVLPCETLYLASVNRSRQIKLLLHISCLYSSLLTSTTTKIAWVIRLYGISAVAMKQWLMLVVMHVGCWSVTGWIHGNKIMSINSMQINSTALYWSGLVYACGTCICVMHCCIHCMWMALAWEWLSFYIT